MRSTKTIGYTPVGTSRRIRIGRTFGITLAVVAVAGLVTGAFFVGRATIPTSDTSTVGGEIQLRDGVPISGRPSAAGAATAASNFQIASVRVSAGTLDTDTAATVLLSANATDTAKRALRRPTTPPESLTQQRESYAPASMVVVSYSQGRRAVVQVWGALTSSSHTVPDPAGSELWTTTTVTLDWQPDHWRVTDQQSQDGPWPARSGQRFSPSEGDFGFRFTEIDGGGWTYVPET